MDVDSFVCHVESEVKEVSEESSRSVRCER